MGVEPVQPGAQNGAALRSPKWLQFFHKPSFLLLIVWREFPPHEYALSGLVSLPDFGAMDTRHALAVQQLPDASPDIAGHD